MEDYIMKKNIFIWSLFITYFIWTNYELHLMHKNIKQVRKEAMFDSHRQNYAEIIHIKNCLEYLEFKIKFPSQSHPEYPEGFPIWEEVKATERDQLIEYLIDASL